MRGCCVVLIILLSSLSHKLSAHYLFPHSTTVSAIDFDSIYVGSIPTAGALTAGKTANYRKEKQKNYENRSINHYARDGTRHAV